MAYFELLHSSTSRTTVYRIHIDQRNKEGGCLIEGEGRKRKKRLRVGSFMDRVVFLLFLHSKRLTDVGKLSDSEISR